MCAVTLSASFFSKHFCSHKTHTYINLWAAWWTSSFCFLFNSYQYGSGSKYWRLSYLFLRTIKLHGVMKKRLQLSFDNWRFRNLRYNEVLHYNHSVLKNNLSTGWMPIILRTSLFTASIKQSVIRPRDFDETDSSVRCRYPEIARECMTTNQKFYIFVQKLRLWNTL